MKKILILVVLFSGFAASSFAQATSTISADASATMILPLSIGKVQDLVFGRLTVYGASGTCTMGLANDRATSGGVDLVPTTGGVFSAEFHIQGEPNATYTLALPADGSVLLHSGGNTMGINTFTSNASGTIGVGGGENFKVGGTLIVDQYQAMGAYTGSFDVTVNYN